MRQVLEGVRRSEKTIEVAMFSFYAFRIAGNLAGAQERGVRVRVLLDHDQALQGPMLRYLLKKKIETRLLAGPGGPGPHSRMHHKFAVFDGRLLANGSYNYSLNAEKRSFETLRFSAHSEVVGGFQNHFESMWNQAKPPDR